MSAPITFAGRPRGLPPVEAGEPPPAVSGTCWQPPRSFPLFARLGSADQQRVFSPGPALRVVLATNVAETSLTVPRIRYVIDSGLARVRRYRIRGKVEQLHIEPISQAAANQRAGRCGRVQDGICIRLFDEDDFRQRPQYTEPEILRSSLAAVILRMSAWDWTRSKPFRSSIRRHPRPLPTAMRSCWNWGQWTNGGN